MRDDDGFDPAEVAVLDQYFEAQNKGARDARVATLALTCERNILLIRERVQRRIAIVGKHTLVMECASLDLAHWCLTLVASTDPELCVGEAQSTISIQAVVDNQLPSDEHAEICRFFRTVRSAYERAEREYNRLLEERQQQRQQKPTRSGKRSFVASR